MAGGQKINDHSFWAGKGANGSVFPMGAKTKSESSAEGAGSVMQYEDTTDRIKSAQTQSVGKIKGHQGKLPTFRN
jgi:hypothetical protein